MAQRQIELKSLAQLVGQEIALSDWLAVPQSLIDSFAEITGDRQWIHVDPARARRESPFGSTIAHGFLTLALLPAQLDQLVAISDARMAVNYGLNRVRFPAPVLVDSRIRVHLHLQSVELIDAPEKTFQVVWRAEFEAQGVTKSVCVAELIVRYYPAAA
ncbi:MAG: MaoC family dehydratase [Burkholderiales bacterium]|nr:MaoC family dehydratase [Burkholderiales bacterium]MDE2287607.1 MaoC family dehydratase [Burkholderiales bacterium]